MKSLDSVGTETSSALSAFSGSKFWLVDMMSVTESYFKLLKAMPKRYDSRYKFTAVAGLLLFYSNLKSA